MFLFYRPERCKTINPLQAVDLTTRAKDVETDAPFRPYTLAVVMRLLRFVMLIDNTPSAQTVVSPCTDLDAPIVVLVLWRHFVPWIWRLLMECSESDTETIVFLVRAPSFPPQDSHRRKQTTTWLHYASDSDPQTSISTLATLPCDEHSQYMILAYLVSDMYVGRRRF